ncbi:MAG: hypothetical protein RL011_151 [Pseudomonadota bacterium]|jgi:hypothetical protein
MSKTETAAPSASVDDKKDSRSRVAEMLQGPRKKRKSYVFFALSKDLSVDLGGQLESLIKSSFKHLGVSRPQNAEELKRGFARQISLMVYDDEFLPGDEGLALLKSMKMRANEASTPILFLTRDPGALIENYSKVLAPFQENDDYLDYRKMTNAEIFNRVRVAVTSGNKRRSRRYRSNIELSYSLLGSETEYKAKIFDLSMHGAMIRDEGGRIFHDAEQLRLSIPLGRMAELADGEFFKLSGRVRRTLMIGKEAGISFEHLTEEKGLMLARIITSLANAQNARRPPSLKIG